ncbi:MAG: glycosyltransferase family 2 protein [Crocinitomicaceae bacterium]|nr:glycosyltransferase family 2 protein [Crocinitomicaceae bacterium]
MALGLFGLLQIMESTLTVIIPAYNEEESLGSFLPKVIDHCNKNSYYLIVVNDGSKDNTRKICTDLAEHESNFQVISHKLNRGYGGAIKTGILYAKTKYVITIDADGQHSLDDVDTLLSQITAEDADMIVGSRINNKNASFYRGFGKWIIRSFAKFLIPMDIHDINSGMKIYNTKLGKKYMTVCPDGMSYSDVILLCFVKSRCLVLETPITIKERIAGKSTINTITAIETMKEILNILILFNPMRFFIPLSIIAFLVSVGWGIPIMYRGDGISVGTMLGITASLIFFTIGLLAEQISQIRLNQIR